MLSLFFFIDRLCRLLSIFLFRPGQDAKLIVFFFKINKKEYKKKKKKKKNKQCYHCFFYRSTLLTNFYFPFFFSF